MTFSSRYSIHFVSWWVVSSWIQDLGAIQCKKGLTGYKRSACFTGIKLEYTNSWTSTHFDFYVSSTHVFPAFFASGCCSTHLPAAGASLLCPNGIEQPCAIHAGSSFQFCKLDFVDLRLTLMIIKPATPSGHHPPVGTFGKHALSLNQVCAFVILVRITSGHTTVTLYKYSLSYSSSSVWTLLSD